MKSNRVRSRCSSGSWKGLRRKHRPALPIAGKEQLRGKLRPPASRALADWAPRRALLRVDRQLRRRAKVKTDDRIRGGAKALASSTVIHRCGYDHIRALRAGALLRSGWMAALSFAAQRESVTVLGAPGAGGATRVSPHVVDQARMVGGAFTHARAARPRTQSRQVGRVSAVWIAGAV